MTATEFLTKELAKRRVGHRLLEVVDGMNGRFSYLRVDSLERLLYMIQSSDSATVRLIGELQSSQVTHYKVMPLIERVLKKRDEVELEYAKSTKEERILSFRVLFALFAVCRASDPSGNVLDYVINYIGEKKDDNAVLMEALECVMAILDANIVLRKGFKERAGYAEFKSYLSTVFNNQEIVKQFKVLLGEDL
eukprot:CAMPEP_0113878174 /NCGR_PEP_ID=MMETSP0780_2-20120614/6520_1 /TAXON_ID=652834 /ORGANISM="Palpitomonas bilix" /LENGTH=192 /DNA_ID=CAMNT_0000864583 /DNA_START=222 /DNA_END=800 /DNA_ORIENTATION=+ /assembly_acc=CAM_ASM_000599